MDQVVRDMSILNEAKRTVEIVVYIAESLDDAQRNNFVVALEQNDGIVSAQFCPLRYHLMLVRYDRNKYSSQDVLSAVRDRNIQARLIGPI